MNSSSSNPTQNNNQHQNPTPLQKKNSNGSRKKLLTENKKNESNRQVTFCKRKGGLVKKASELSTLIGSCGLFPDWQSPAHSYVKPTQSAVILPFPRTRQSGYRYCIESVSGDVIFSNLFVKFIKLIKVVIEASCGLGSNVSYRYSLRFGIGGKRFSVYWRGQMMLQLPL